MAYTRTMPDGWTMTAGVWGTDAQREDVLAQSGGSSLKLGGTNVTVAFLSDKIPLDLNTEYEVYAIVRTDSIVADAKVDIQLLVYNEDTNEVSETINLKDPDTPLSGANQWLFIGAPFDRDTTANKNAKWARFLIHKHAYNFNLYVDRVELRRNPPSRVLAATTVDYRLPIAGQNSVFFNLPSNYLEAREIGIVKHETENKAIGIKCKIPGWYYCEIRLLIDPPFPSSTFFYRLGVGKDVGGGLLLTSYSAVHSVKYSDVNPAFNIDGLNTVGGAHSAVMRMETDDIFYAFVAAQNIFISSPSIQGQPASAIMTVSMLT